MKYMVTALYCMLGLALFSQTLQVHYDPRHSLQPKYDKNNFVTLYFEYFKLQDSGKAFIKPGSFLLTMQADLLGEKNNIGKVYTQVSQSFRCWKPGIFVTLQYNGGLGITEPKEYSYYIVNNFCAGLSVPFKWGKAYLSAILQYKLATYTKPSHDVMYTLYWWKGLFNYHAEFSGNFSLWTDNKNHGDGLTPAPAGKRILFLAQPQAWYKISNTWGIGTKINTYYHVITTGNEWNIYPTLAIRCKL